jgi:GTPase Era involved in 16S rRNA processing
VTSALTTWEGSRSLQRSITQEASDAALDADLVCLVVDAARTWNDDSEDQLHRLRKLRDDMLSQRAQLAGNAEAPAAGAQSTKDDALFVLVMNKCDLVPLERAQRKAHLINQSGLFAKTFFLSAMRDNYVDQLRDYLVSRAVRRDWDFPPEWVSDLSPMEMVEECIREQLLARLNQELPYHIKQRNLGWTDLEDGSLRIDQYLIVEHLRAKRIVVGANAGTIRVISDRARARIGERLKRTVHLFLTVKVEEPK